jgi:hypothetical protein
MHHSGEIVAHCDKESRARLVTRTLAVAYPERRLWARGFASTLVPELPSLFEMPGPTIRVATAAAKLHVTILATPEARTSNSEGSNKRCNSDSAFCIRPLGVSNVFRAARDTHVAGKWCGRSL